MAGQRAAVTATTQLQSKPCIKSNYGTKLVGKATLHIAHCRLRAVLYTLQKRHIVHTAHSGVTCISDQNTVLLGVVEHVALNVWLTTILTQNARTIVGIDLVLENPAQPLVLHLDPSILPIINLVLTNQWVSSCLNNGQDSD